MNDLQLQTNDRTETELETAQFMIPEFYLEGPVSASQPVEATNDQLASPERRYLIALEDAALTECMFGDNDRTGISVEDRTMLAQVEGELTEAYEALMVETIHSISLGSEDAKIATAKQYAEALGLDLAGSLTDVHVAKAVVDLLNQARTQKEKDREAAESAITRAWQNTYFMGAAGRLTFTRGNGVSKDIYTD